jgi:hypothetical protein
MSPNFQIDRIEQKVIFPFRLCLSNIHSFPLTGNPSNLFLFRKENNDKKQVIEKLIEELNNSEKYPGIGGVGDFNHWKPMDFSEELPPEEDLESGAWVENRRGPHAVFKNRKRIVKCTFAYNANAKSLFDKKYDLNLVFKRLRGWVVGKDGEAMQIKEGESLEGFDASANLKTIDIWFYDWNLGGLDLNFEIKCSDKSYESGKKLARKTSNLAYIQSENFPESASDKGSSNQILANLIDVFAKVLIEKAKLKENGEKNAGSRSHARFLYSYSTHSFLFFNEVRRGGKRLGDWLPLVEKGGKSRIAESGETEFPGFDTQKPAIFVNSTAERIVLWEKDKANTYYAESKVIWLWRLNTMYAATLEWLNALYSKQIDEISQLYLKPIRKGGILRKITLVNFVTRLKQNYLLEQTRKKLLRDNHHSRNRLVSMMGELSPTYICDNGFERMVYQRLRNENHLDDLEKGIVSLAETLIKEQSQYQSELRSFQIKLLSGFVALNIVLSITLNIPKIISMFKPSHHATKGNPVQTVVPPLKSQSHSGSVDSLLQD